MPTGGEISQNFLEKLKPKKQKQKFKYLPINTIKLKIESY